MAPWQPERCRQLQSRSFAQLAGSSIDIKGSCITARPRSREHHCCVRPQTYHPPQLHNNSLYKAAVTVLALSTLLQGTLLSPLPSGHGGFMNSTPSLARACPSVGHESISTDILDVASLSVELLILSTPPPSNFHLHDIS